MDRERRRLLIAAILLGIGLGGFFDGIVLHQVLQWHHLVSNPVPPDTLADLELNTLADGLFHAATWIVTLAGVLLLLLAGEERSGVGAGRRFAAGMLIGWGGFNLVEGLVDHHLLGLHRVRPGPDELLWDVGFLAWGLLMVIGGMALLRRPDPTRYLEGDDHG
jgi:uncharacterized membrane protein